MAANSHHLAIAKASLSAGLLRADPTPVSRDDITEFHNLLEQTLTFCSLPNIQNCKRWILNNMTSPVRLASFAKYISAFSSALSDSTVPQGKCSKRRRRLHLLYLVSDLLHHTKYHQSDSGSLADAIKDVLQTLFTNAAYSKGVKQLARLERLLSIWESKQYYPRQSLEELRTAIKDTVAAKPQKSEGATETSSQNKQKAQFLPPLHGDPSIPFYDLPAGNFLPHIIPNSTAPINTRAIKPVHFSSITPSGTLATAVQGFLAAVDTMFSGKDIMDEPDAVGGFGGLEGEGYYGWSKEFCERMKQKKKTAIEKERLGMVKESERGRRRRYSYSSDSYSSRSRSPSPERSKSRHSRSRRRSRSRSSYDSSRSRSRSRSRDRSGYRDNSRPRSHSGVRSMSNPRSAAKFQQFTPAHQSIGSQNPLPPPPPPPLGQGFPPLPPPMAYGYPPQQQQQLSQNWVPPHSLPPNVAGFPPPNLLQGLQQFGQFPMPGMPIGFGVTGQQGWQPPQNQSFNNAGGHNLGNLGNSEENYRSKQMGGKRGGWKK